MNSYFYNELIEDKKTKSMIQFFQTYAEEQMKQVFIIQKPLGTNYDYSYTEAAAILIPRHKILIVNWGKEGQEFDEYYDDFIEDLGHISDKYNYKDVIGRNRQWRKLIFETINISSKTNFSQVVKDMVLSNPDEARLSQLLISLLTGSINDITKVGKEVPIDVLDAVKRRIVLYDAKQTDFIFKKFAKKVIKIQGLAGTGKTELLLRKLKELYTNNETKNCRIALTCFNRILAKNLRDRIPAFFDFLKVEEQIKWNETLFVMSSWGSNNQKYSGIYSYICSHYSINFYPFSYETSFDFCCKKAIEMLKEKEELIPCFDYMLIDESQDFPQSFFELCELVTNNQVYIAGDIFQNIFDISKIETNPDFLLNSCYRTDPKTLIFAHSMGMGILDHDDPKDYISWLTDDEWKMCGYDYLREDNKFTFSRKPLNRFDDIDISKIPSVTIVKDDFDKYDNQILSIIKELRKNYPTITPDDIGIVFLENESANYKLMDRLASLIYDEFDWKINFGYVSKTKREGSLFVSNINNVKGLEFPFVICLSKNKLNTSLRNRNAIYMILTRSFISSYFILSDQNSDENINCIIKNLDHINDKGELTVIEPTEGQKEEKRQTIISKKNINKSQREIANEIMDELNISELERNKIHKALKVLLEDENDVTAIREAVENIVRIVQ